MNAQVFIPVVAALIAALASIGGVLYSQNNVLRVESVKWEKSRADETRRAQASALSDYAREISTAVQRITYIMWQVEMTSNALTSKEFSTYEQETKQQFPRLFASQVMLATTNVCAYNLVEPVARKFYKLDERIVVAGRRFTTARQSGARDVRGRGWQETQTDEKNVIGAEALNPAGKTTPPKNLLIL